MGATWVLWIVLLVLVITHVAMFAAGVAAYHLLRMLNFKPMAVKQPMSDAKLLQMADKIAREQVNAERFAHFDRNQMVNRPVEESKIEDSFVPSVKK